MNAGKEETCLIVAKQILLHITKETGKYADQV